MTNKEIEIEISPSGMIRIARDDPSKYTTIKKMLVDIADKDSLDAFFDETELLFGDQTLCG